jgi:quercetin dioxygenase-like cupin family protein
MTQEDLEVRAARLADLVDYQPESIVSRSLLSKQSGNVTLFAFDAGQSLSEHTTPHDALVFCAEGTMEITIEDQVHRLSEGDLLLMPANRPHAVTGKERSKMLLIMLRD